MSQLQEASLTTISFFFSLSKLYKDLVEKHNTSVKEEKTQKQENAITTIIMNFRKTM